MKILYVEDNKTDAELTRKKLNKDIPGCEFKVASSLSDARKQTLKGNVFDLVLLDMCLPDGSGLDFLIEIKQKSLPCAVIVLTGSGDEELAVAALKAGADDYVVKKAGYLDTLDLAIEVALLTRKEKKAEKNQILKVLYVERNKADIELTGKHLRNHAPNINLTVCSTTDKVLNLLNNSNSKTCDYDVLLTDYRLTGLNGLELIKTIRQKKQLSLAIVMVTGQGDEDIAIQALRLGADEYLVKRHNYLFRLPSLLMSAFHQCELEKKQLELLNSEERYRRLTDNAQDIVYRYEFLPVRRFSFVSPAATKITGYTPEEHYNDPDLRSKLMHPDDIHIMKNMTKHMDRLLILRWIRKDGNTIWTEQRNVPIFDDDGNIQAIEGIVRDITEQKLASDKLAQERILLKTLINNLPDNIYIKDTQLRKILVNKADLNLIGKSEEEVIGKKDSELFPAEVARQFMADDRLVIEKGQPVLNREELLVNHLGQKIWLTTSKLPLYNNEGHITGLIGMGHNITKRKHTDMLLKERERKLKEKNEEYQKLNKEYWSLNEELTENIERIQQMYKELKIAKEKAEESDKLKTAFLANMSHEIRTPMNGILGFTQILRKSPLDDKQHEHYLDIINKSCDRLLSVIDDIIDISQIETGIINLQYCDLNLVELMNDLQDFFLETLKNKNLSLVIQNNLPHELADCNTDGMKLQEILSNLIDNAIKFTEKGSISITFGLKNKMLEFSVKDTGIGIAENKHAIIFDRFRQVDDRSTRTYGGSGLGLAIAKAYVNQLGGEIRLESIMNKGTTFYFSIPFISAKKEEPKRGEVKEEKEYDWSGKKILIAEDERINYEYIAEVLESTGITILHANNGEEAVNIFKSSNPDLILMDIKMPGMDGYLATKIIRKKNKKIPIIALTAYALDMDKAKTHEAGFDAHITKPVYIETMLAMLDKYLRKSAQ